MSKILLLEDEVDLAHTIKELLENEGYSVDLALKGEEAVDLSYENSYDLYIFDINLPDINGIEFLKDLKNADDKTPALFISALVDINTIAKGFEAGAEDYIKKPFLPQELIIRVNAKLKKTSQDIVYKNYRFDTNKKELFKDNKLIPLSGMLRCLCNEFMNNIGNTVDKTVLFDCLENPSDTALRVAINKLKQLSGLEIKNIRGIGYILEKS